MQDQDFFFFVNKKLLDIESEGNMAFTTKSGLYSPNVIKTLKGVKRLPLSLKI